MLRLPTRSPQSDTLFPYPTRCLSLIAGGVDAILIETCQDPLQVKAAVNGAKLARAAAAVDVPLMVQVTVETTGTLLVGADVAAAATVLKALDVPIVGLNCAKTGRAHV